uniref:ATP-dependent DNA helicase n=1 Tax=Amphimedon queenslandica TaxID=400682 RepID=A0A1X7U6Z4_AMPQE
MDLQYIAERSLSLTEYVTGYVTKAEKSHAQDLWDEVSSCDNIYSRLWKIGQKLLQAKEVGLYEASDLLLGESLYMKSVTVQDESTLVMEGETMEEAFRRNREASIRGIENHFNKLQKLLQAERYWKKIVDARNKASFTEEPPINKEDYEPQLLGLVNGATGRVMGIYATRISIKFDHIDVPCDIERVTSRFMLSKNLYIHRKQFPLILSYAITIHKCQGLTRYSHY